jgi:hypothetical protein
MVPAAPPAAPEEVGRWAKLTLLAIAHDLEPVAKVCV